MAIVTSYIVYLTHNYQYMSYMHVCMCGAWVSQLKPACWLEYALLTAI